MTPDIEKLIEFLPDGKQKEYLQAWLRLGSQAKVAQEFGVHPSTVNQAVKLARRKALKQGWSPEHDMTRTAPEGYSIKGVSTLYDSSGQVSAQWVKSNRDKQDQLEALMDAIEPLAERVAGKSLFVEPPKVSDKDLLCVYPLGDPHIGMHAWAEETGDRDFDLKIAQKNMLGAMQQVVDATPPAEQALIINLGDFFHADNSDNRTRNSGNALDVDGRYAKVLYTGVDLMIRTTEIALAKHNKVTVYNIIGNHDDHGAITLAVCMKRHFENNPRAEIITQPRQFHYHEFGKCLLGMNHGHMAKVDLLPGIMAADQAEAWGRTKFRRWYRGHVHHESVKEFAGCTVETFRTLAPKDAWHAAAGYRAGNDIRADVWHAEWGLINRHIIGIEKVLNDVK